MLGLIFVSILLIETGASNDSVPHWKDLECQVMLITGSVYICMNLSCVYLSDWSQIPIL